MYGRAMTAVLAAPLSQLSAAAAAGAAVRQSVRGSRGVWRRLSVHSRLCRREPHDVVDAAEKKVMLNQSEIFDEVGRQQKARDKSAFMKSLQIYEQKQSVHRRAHVEFIHAATSRMEEFGVQKDLEVYKAVFNIFPKKVMVPVNVWQAEMMHYPKQQDCALDILQKMENFGVIPDDKTGDLIVSIFGMRSHVMRKYQRMMYWMPKFKHMNPYPVPPNLPSDPAELAVLALKRMAVDPENKVTLYNISDDADLAASAADAGGSNVGQRRFVASAQSPEQAALLAEQPASAPLYVDGPHLVWLRDKSVKCFVLQTDRHRAAPASATAVHDSSQPTKDAAKEDDSWLDTLDSSLTSEGAAAAAAPGAAVARSSLHHQPSGIVLAMCVPWAAHKDAALAWIAMLQRDNPHLARLAVVLKLRSSSSPSDGSSPCEELLHQRLLDSASSERV